MAEAFTDTNVDEDLTIYQDSKSERVMSLYEENELEMGMSESRRWIEKMTGHFFPYDDFVRSIQDGILLCLLIEKLLGKTIGRIKRISTPWASLENATLFLQGCRRLGLKEYQLFDISDAQFIVSRPTTLVLQSPEGQKKLRNILVCIYWLGLLAKESGNHVCSELNFNAFAELLLPRAPDTKTMVQSKRNSWGGKPAAKEDKTTKDRLSLRKAKKRVSFEDEVNKERKGARVAGRGDVRQKQQKFESLAAEHEQAQARYQFTRSKSSDEIKRGRSQEIIAGHSERSRSTDPLSSRDSLIRQTRAAMQKPTANNIQTSRDVPKAWVQPYRKESDQVDYGNREIRLSDAEISQPRDEAQRLKAEGPSSTYSSKLSEARDSDSLEKTSRSEIKASVSNESLGKDSRQHRRQTLDRGERPGFFITLSGVVAKPQVARVQRIDSMESETSRHSDANHRGLDTKKSHLETARDVNNNTRVSNYTQAWEERGPTPTRTVTNFEERLQTKRNSYSSDKDETRTKRESYGSSIDFSSECNSDHYNSRDNLKYDSTLLLNDDEENKRPTVNNTYHNTRISHNTTITYNQPAIKIDQPAIDSHYSKPNEGNLIHRGYKTDQNRVQEIDDHDHYSLYYKQVREHIRDEENKRSSLDKSGLTAQQLMADEKLNLANQLGLSQDVIELIQEEEKFWKRQSELKQWRKEQEERIQQLEQSRVRYAYDIAKERRIAELRKEHDDRKKKTMRANVSDSDVKRPKGTAKRRSEPPARQLTVEQMRAVEEEFLAQEAERFLTAKFQKEALKNPKARQSNVMDSKPPIKHNPASRRSHEAQENHGRSVYALKPIYRSEHSENRTNSRSSDDSNQNSYSKYAKMNGHIHIRHPSDRTDSGYISPNSHSSQLINEPEYSKPYTRQVDSSNNKTSPLRNKNVDRLKKPEKRVSGYASPGDEPIVERSRQSILKERTNVNKARSHSAGFLSEDEDVFYHNSQSEKNVKPRACFSDDEFYNDNHWGKLQEARPLLLKQIYHIRCVSCKKQIYEEDIMNIEGQDLFWHYDCFYCVVCRTKLLYKRNRYASGLRVRIINSKLHCNHCYSTNGDQLTEV